MTDYHNHPATTSRNHIEELRELLPGAVLVPVPYLSKRPVVSGWSKITFEQTQDSSFKVSRKLGSRSIEAPYASELVRGNVAVALGEQSGGLFTIDIDDDNGVDPFLTLNPWTKTTLITKRKRGCNVWFYLHGEYPKSKPITTGGSKPWGEFRGDGNVTMIYGKAQDKSKGEPVPLTYVRLNDAKPAQISFKDIAWPDGVISPILESADLLGRRTPPQQPLPSSIQLSDYTATGLSGYTPTPLYTYTASTEAKREYRKRQEAAEDALKLDYPALEAMYARRFEPKFRNAPGGRNAFVVHCAPLLFRAVGETMFVYLMKHFYECNASFFKSTPEQHQREVLAALKGVKESYLAELSPDELAFYSDLTKD